MTDENKVKALVDGTVDDRQTQVSLREDLEAGLRFLHLMGMQTKLDLVDMVSTLFALQEELVMKGQLDLESFDKRRIRYQGKEEARLKERPHVQLTDPIDKHKMDNLPQIDCQSRINLCKARCCKLAFSLSFQDLDERILQWDYSKPYQIRQNPDGYCVHNDSSSKWCGVYENRPAACRAYDCREDKRIWIDFEKRIPAPENDNERIRENAGS